ncbi:alpha/beta fold hydrolase [Agromyces atrinae]|uniref:alpha/beta fold hydrolase n=1 Tax=Agromyces atrinae TaxID=592376 RepID=UPI001F5ACA78|nr:alpha/beta fold hydrolase [Agromyces atrinae]MCI2958438.1 alpha/beta fold hydrolase [Agromyces atrinae]
MNDPQTVVFLHGLGVGPDSWAAQIDDLPDGYTAFAPRIVGLAESDPPFSMAAATAAVIRSLDEGGIERAHLCGLSLGAMLALQIAVERPERVASLVLSDGQVHPPRALMALQSLLMRVLPERIVAPDGSSRERVRGVLVEVAQIDFRDDLADIAVPTLVVCGSKDVANLPAARSLAAGIPGARLRIIEGGRHELNTEKPREFSAELRSFLEEEG